MTKEKELYRQRKEAQLDEWKAELDKLKATAKKAGVDAQIEWQQHVRRLESEVAAGKASLSRLADAGDEAWDSIKEGVEESWRTLRSSLDEAASKFKR